jgi:hypothetical protein
MRMNNLKIQVMRYKLDNGCQICGYNRNPRVLQFSHRDPETKYRDRNGKVVEPSDMIKGRLRPRYGPETVWNEISKCDVLCANCHAEKTFPLDITPL